MKPGTYRTVKYAYLPVCGAWSAGPGEDDLEGQGVPTDKDQDHVYLKIKDGDDVTSVGCGKWKRIS